MGASKIRSTVPPPRRDLIAPIPQSFINHNAVVEPRPLRTLAGLQARVVARHAATDDALADPNLPAGAIETIAAGRPCTSAEIGAVLAWIRLEAALADEHGASKALANFIERNPPQSLAEVSE
jgi:hypothetical protein